MIMGQENPDTGSFITGDTVKVSYVDQQHTDIDPEKQFGNKLQEVMN